MKPPFLKPGALAPGFSLPTPDGLTVTRSQYRNKSGLALIFALSPGDPGIVPLLEGVAKNADAWRKLNARPYLIARGDDGAGDSPVPLLIDADGVTWRTYSGLENEGYGVFILDKYGGVDTQIVGESTDVLPDAHTLYELMQSTMYKCNI
jgi:hypothetical protein